MFKAIMDMTFDAEPIHAVLRILFGAFAAARTLQLIRFRRSLWAGRLTRRTRNALLAFQMVSAVLIALGLFTFPAACAHFLAAAHLTRNSWRGGETALWQGLSFYFAWAPAAGRFSLDAALRWTTPQLLPDGNALPRVALAVFVGAWLWDTALNLRRDPFWRMGRVISRLMADPRFSRARTARLMRGRFPRRLDGAVFVFLAAFVPAILVNGVPAGALFSLVLALSSIALTIAFTPLWTGIALALTGAILLVANAQLGFAGLALAAATDLARTTGVYPVTASVLLALFTLVPLLRFLPPNWKFARRLARIASSWGFGGGRGRHRRALSKPAAYRSFFIGYSGDLNETFRAFNFAGNPAVDAAALPEFLTAMAEAIRRAEKEFLATRTLPLELARLITAFSEDLAALCRKRLGRPPAKLLFRVADLSLPGERHERQLLHEIDPWRDAFQVEFSGRKAVRIRKLS